MNATEAAVGRTTVVRVERSRDSEDGSMKVGREERPPDRTEGSTVDPSVGRSKKVESVEATTMPKREAGITLPGKNWEIVAHSIAIVALSGVVMNFSWPTKRTIDRAFKNPARMLSETRLTYFVNPKRPMRNCRRDAVKTTSGIRSSRPVDVTKAPNGTATTAAEPTISPGRIPPATDEPPITTELQRPTSGGTPTIEEQAMAFASKLKETVTPARISLIGSG